MIKKETKISEKNENETLYHTAACSLDLKRGCLKECARCPCEDCDKRFDCDGGNPFFGCGQ